MNITEAKLPLTPTMGCFARTVCICGKPWLVKGRREFEDIPLSSQGFLVMVCFLHLLYNAHTCYKLNVMKLYRRNRKVGPNGRAKFNWSMDDNWGVMTRATDSGLPLTLPPAIFSVVQALWDNCLEGRIGSLRLWGRDHTQLGKGMWDFSAAQILACLDSRRPLSAF